MHSCVNGRHSDRGQTGGLYTVYQLVSLPTLDAYGNPHTFPCKIEGGKKISLFPPFT